jgi:hypothetical protein
MRTVHFILFKLDTLLECLKVNSGLAARNFELETLNPKLQTLTSNSKPATISFVIIEYSEPALLEVCVSAHKI